MQYEPVQFQTLQNDIYLVTGWGRDTSLPILRFIPVR